MFLALAQGLTALGGWSLSAIVAYRHVLSLANREEAVQLWLSFRTNELHLPTAPSFFSRMDQAKVLHLSRSKPQVENRCRCPRWQTEDMRVSILHSHPPTTIIQSPANTHLSHPTPKLPFLPRLDLTRQWNNKAYRMWSA